MVSDQYRYSRSSNGEEKLFDLKADRDEWTNLDADPAQTEPIAAMRAAVEEAWKGDEVPEPPSGGGLSAKGKSERTVTNRRRQWRGLFNDSPHFKWHIRRGGVVVAIADPDMEAIHTGSARCFYLGVVILR